MVLCLAVAFNTDRHNKGLVASASALGLGGETLRSASGEERLRPVFVSYDLLGTAGVNSSHPVNSVFAQFGLGTPEAPRLRPSIGDSFDLVASNASAPLFIRTRSADMFSAADLAISDMPLPRPRPSGMGGVRVASLGNDAAIDAGPRRKQVEPIFAEGLPRSYPKGSDRYLDVIKREARANGVPLWIALGVIWVESKYNPTLRGSHGVLGMMQVMPSTARYIGYTGSNDQLLEAETNIVWGMKELGKDYKLANGDLCLTIAKYTGGFMTKRVRPAAQRYCSEVRRITGMPEDAARVASAN